MRMSRILCHTCTKVNKKYEDFGLGFVIKRHIITKFNSNNKAIASYNLKSKEVHVFLISDNYLEINPAKMKSRRKVKFCVLSTINHIMMKVITQLTGLKINQY